jgi:hypothetical protein
MDGGTDDFGVEHDTAPKACRGEDSLLSIVRQRHSLLYFTSGDDGDDDDDNDKNSSCCVKSSNSTTSELPSAVPPPITKISFDPVGEHAA